MVTNNAANNKTGASGTVLQGQGVGTASDFSTATYPATTTVSQILYSSSSNTIAGLATANSGVLSTSSAGVPSIDTTNFAVLTTGLQLKGNNTNTTPPAGFIGESITASATAVSLLNTTPANVTSISLTAGIWDVSGIVTVLYTGASTASQIAISTNTASLTGTVLGDTQWQSNIATTGGDVTGSIPQKRVLLSGTTTYYLIGVAFFSTGSATGNGRISATRVG